jgi:aquaporin TIP
MMMMVVMMVMVMMVMVMMMMMMMMISCAASLTSDSSLTPAGLTAIALSHAFALFVAISVSSNISGGHVNPAVTFALFIGGYINLLKGALYWVAQLAGATIACLFLTYVAKDVVSSP